jgi:hypothetical protein
MTLRFGRTTALGLGRRSRSALYDVSARLQRRSRRCARVVERYHRWRCSSALDAYDAAPDPFAVRSADPTDITRFSGREYPQWTNRGDLFGTVAGGDWDRRPPPVATHHRSTPAALYLAPRVAESVAHRSVVAHFADGVPWTETPLVAAVLDAVEAGEGPVWKGCRTVADVETRCRRLDEVFAEMRRGGYRSRETVARRAGRTDVPLLDRLDEVAVDVGRDGELLFVDGRHRLAMALLLGVDRIPVVVLVRHAEWMRTREAVAAAVADRGDRLESVLADRCVDASHPDLVDLLAGRALRADRVDRAVRTSRADWTPSAGDTGPGGAERADADAGRPA